MRLTYKQTTDYLFSQLPMFQRIGPPAYKATLDRTYALSHYLGKPENAFRSIHVAGTNGKGSVSHMLASVLQEQGYKTGLATSPHLRDFRERIKINGQPIPKREVAHFVSLHKAFLDHINPSFFEMTMAMTFAWFAAQKVDVAVVETGMGGRLDSSNIITPELSVITNIGFDHVRFLGPDLTGIAREKAGIIKEGVPVVVGLRQPEVEEVFHQAACHKNVPLLFASDHYKVTGNNSSAMSTPGSMIVDVKHAGKNAVYQLGLQGFYQMDNLVTVLAAIEMLNSTVKLFLGHDAVKNGLNHVVKNTGLLGRWQQIGKRPPVICDAAHNVDGIRRVMAQVASVPHSQTRMVFGLVDDKDRASILQCLPQHAHYYFCKPDIPRGLDAKKLASDASFFGLRGEVYHTVKDALAAAKRDASAKDLIFIGGSTFVVAEVI